MGNPGTLLQGRRQEDPEELAEYSRGRLHASGRGVILLVGVTVCDRLHCYHAQQNDLHLGRFPSKNVAWGALFVQSVL